MTDKPDNYPYREISDSDFENPLDPIWNRLDPWQNDFNSWRDKQGNSHPIKEMETSHIINCMKLLEKVTFERIKGFTPGMKRKMAAVALFEDKQYQNMEKELYVRFKKGLVTLSDFFFCVKQGKKKVKL